MDLWRLAWSVLLILAGAGVRAALGIMFMLAAGAIKLRPKW